MKIRIDLAQIPHAVLASIIVSPIIMLVYDNEIWINSHFVYWLGIVTSISLIALGYEWMIRIHRKRVKYGHSEAVGVLQVVCMELYVIIVVGYAIVLLLFSIRAMAIDVFPEDIFSPEIIVAGIITGTLCSGSSTYFLALQEGKRKKRIY